MLHLARTIRLLGGLMPLLSLQAEIARFIEVRGLDGQSTFIANMRSASIRIQADGWSSLDRTGNRRAGLPFVGASPAARFNATPAPRTYSPFDRPDHPRPIA